MGLVFQKLQDEIAKYKCVLIDLDDTLYDYKSAHEIAISEVFQKQIIFKDFKEFKKNYRENRDLTTRELSPLATCRSRYLAFLKMAEEKSLSSPFVIADKLDTLYWSFLIQNIKPFPDALDFLKFLKQKNIPVAIVSDMTTKIQIEKINKLGVSNLINFLVTSEDVGVEKPHPKIFETAMQKLNMSPKECIMIGDSFEKDIIGAQKLGIKSFLVEQK